MLKKSLYKFFYFQTLTQLLLISSISNSFANSTKYLCSQGMLNLYVIFDEKNKAVTSGKDKPKKYWTEGNKIFWLSANDVSVYEYTFENSYNRLSGELEIKIHNLITSENKWFSYKCAVNQ